MNATERTSAQSKPTLFKAQSLLPGQTSAFEKQISIGNTASAREKGGNGSPPGTSETVDRGATVSDALSSAFSQQKIRKVDSSDDHEDGEGDNDDDGDTYDDANDESAGEYND